MSGVSNDGATKNANTATKALVGRRGSNPSKPGAVQSTLEAFMGGNGGAGASSGQNDSLPTQDHQIAVPDGMALLNGPRAQPTPTVSRPPTPPNLVGSSGLAVLDSTTASASSAQLPPPGPSAEDEPRPPTRGPSPMRTGEISYAEIVGATLTQLMQTASSEGAASSHRSSAFQPVHATQQAQSQGSQQPQRVQPQPQRQATPAASSSSAPSGEDGSSARKRFREDGNIDETEVNELSPNVDIEASASRTQHKQRKENELQARIKASRAHNNVLILPQFPRPTTQAELKKFAQRIQGIANTKYEVEIVEISAKLGRINLVFESEEHANKMVNELVEINGQSYDLEMAVEGFTISLTGNTAKVDEQAIRNAIAK
ncbi:hypothetical protein CAOG_010244 [Capsaspora owczarzaki ATCC 30864]|uniref:Uncharacterized protein n=1 Tax=Capsaspora owczarzaki (strain ATCC 30864) TaxID=595528 RepID=A0A0D2X5U8_CAPO3|nr:hypothetical protein CAOG_010244 [Capsaspora owczarzaki ATCC 30864]